jgi:phage terminase small subunit
VGSGDRRPGTARVVEEFRSRRSGRALRAWSRFVAAVKRYRAEGVVKVNPDSGRLGKHAAVAVAENAAVQMAKLGGLLGLSPVAERGLGSFAPVDPDDPFA